MTEDQSEERISKHERRSSEIIKSDEEKKKSKALCDIFQHVNQFMHYGILEESEKGAKHLHKFIMAENFTNLKKEVDLQIKESQ